MAKTWAVGNGLSFSIDTSGLERRLDVYRQNLYHVIRSEWAQILQEILADIVSRALPGKSLEDMYILGGAQYPMQTYIPAPVQGGIYTDQYGRRHDMNYRARVGGGTSGNQWIHDAAYRTHLVDRRLSLAEAAVDPMNWELDQQNLAIRIGRISWLEDATKISWVNYSRSSGAYSHTSEYGIWSFFEYGRTNTVVPRNWGGNTYKLKPEGSHWSSGSWAWQMTKSYPALHMYTSANLGFQIRNSLAQRLQVVKF
jgi:hypothetical protein